MEKDYQVSRQELEKQKEYSELVATVLSSRYGQYKPKAYVHTYGCQGNVSDSERLQGALEQMGYDFTDEVESADLILYNTCAIREHAQDRVFGNVGALKQIKKNKPELIIALCGCMTQQKAVAEKFYKSYPFVDLLFGTHSFHRLPEFIYKCLCGKGRVFDITEGDGVIAEDVPVRRDGKIRAWIPIMYGCNNYCSYCIVPYVRGRERSRSFDAVLNEVRQVISQGYKDITLLGQNVNSYNKDKEQSLRFPALLREINSLPGDFTIRFMTSHPRDCTFELIDAMAECDKVAKHLHLPFQSGNDRVLSLMNRHYDREKYLQLIDYAYERMPELSITSDVIVGFPGETYEEFKDTLSLIERVRFTSLFTFIFSPRPGTKAYDMQDPVSREEKGRWFSELTALQESIAAQRTAAMKGKTYRVLVEGKGKAEGMLSGRTTGNVIIEFLGDEALIGQFTYVRATNPRTWVVYGETV